MVQDKYHLKIKYNAIPISDPVDLQGEVTLLTLTAVPSRSSELVVMPNMTSELMELTTNVTSVYKDLELTSSGQYRMTGLKPDTNYLITLTVSVGGGGQIDSEPLDARTQDGGLCLS